MIELKNVRKAYSSKRGERVQALDGVSFAFGNRGMYFILGKSGSGKSTLLNIIGGLDRADEGDVFYDGIPLSSFAGKDFENYRNNAVGFVFQEFNLIEKFSVYENVELALKMQREERCEEKVALALETVGLSGYEKRSVSELSGGQKQRVAIARALVKNSEIILADEPTGNLDSETGAEIFCLLKDIAKTKTVIVVSHDRENAEKYGDAVIEIKDGLIVSEDVSGNILGTEERAGGNAAARGGRPRLPFSFIAKMAWHNLLYKKWRTVVTIAATVLSVLLVCAAQVFYSVNTEDNIAKSAADLGKQYLRLEQFSGVDSYGVPSFSSSINERACGYLKEEGFTFLRTGDISNKSVLIAESPAHIKNFGLEFYGEEPASLADGFYVADVYIESALASGSYFEEGDLTYEEMAGKELLKKVKPSPYEDILIERTPIAGVLRTRFGKSAQSLGDQMDRNLFSGRLFCSEAYYLEQKGARPFVRAQEGKFSLTLRSGGSERKYAEDILLSEFSNSEAYALTGVGYRAFTDDNNLGKEEILLSRSLYNSLYGQEIEPWPGEFEDFSQEDPSTWYLADYTPAHIGETIDLTFVQDELGEELLSLQGKKLAGVIIGDNGYPGWNGEQEEPYQVYTAPGEVSAALSPRYPLYGGGASLILKTQGFSKTALALRSLRSAYGMGVGHDDSDAAMFDFGFYFYSQEESFANMQSAFLYMAIVAFAVGMLLLIALISFGITSRKKEIGILKALGCGNGSIRRIYLFESLMIGVITFIFSVPAVYFSIFGINRSMWNNGLTGITFFMTNAFTWLIAFGISIAAVVLFAYLPLIRISKLKPVDAIRGN